MTHTISRNITTSVLALNVLSATLLLSGNATEVSAESSNAGPGKACVAITRLAYAGCGFEAKEDVRENVANCINLIDSRARSQCMNAAREERLEARENCRDVRDARNSVCRDLGGKRYDISRYWVPQNFVDPTEIGSSVSPNPYFDLTPGRTRVLETEEETVTVTYTDDTKNINGIDCIVVNDIAAEDGEIVEDTDDWFAQDVAGNVWYCGEISKNFESFDGDDPEKPELTDVDGSWKAFVEYAQPGIVMFAAPEVGKVYRQEYALGEAEDVAEVISSSADGLLSGDICEPEVADLIAQLCNGDCVVTRETTPLEPAVLEHKYYAPNVGIILEVNKAEGGCVPVSD